MSQVFVEAMAKNLETLTPSDDYSKRAEGIAEDCELYARRYDLLQRLRYRIATKQL
jgi:hypothetical protein